MSMTKYSNRFRKATIQRNLRVFFAVPMHLFLVSDNNKCIEKRKNIYQDSIFTDTNLVALQHFVFWCCTPELFMRYQGISLHYVHFIRLSHVHFIQFIFFLWTWIYKREKSWINNMLNHNVYVTWFPLFRTDKIP